MYIFLRPPAFYSQSTELCCLPSLIYSQHPSARNKQRNKRRLYEQQEEAIRVAGGGYMMHHCRESQPTGSPGTMMMMHDAGMLRCRVLRTGTRVANGPRQSQQWGQKSDLAPSSPEAAPKRFSIASIHPRPCQFGLPKRCELPSAARPAPCPGPKHLMSMLFSGGGPNHISPSCSSTCSSAGSHPPLLPLPHPRDSGSSPAQGSASPPSTHQLVRIACLPLPHLLISRDGQEGII